MRILRWASWIGLALGVFGFLGASLAESYLARKSVLGQRVRFDPTVDALFGDSGQPVGSPQHFVVLDRGMLTGALTPEGAQIVDENYLERTGTYPLQLKTVRFVALYARVGCAGLVAFSLLVWWWVRVRARARRSPGASGTA